jgi:hypothetical protein
MIAVLPFDFETVPLRRTYAADKALAWVRREIDLTQGEQERFRQHVEIANRKDRRNV